MDPLNGMFQIIQSQSVRFLKYNRFSSVFPGDLATDFKERYRFVETPQRAVDFTNTQNGLNFLLGRFGDTTIQKLAIYTNGMLAEGAAPTEELDLFLDDVLDIVRKQFDLSTIEGSPVSRLYGSKIEIKSTANLSRALAGLSGIAETLTHAVTGYGVSARPYQVGGISIVSEKIGDGTITPARFVFERRAEKPLDDNLFYSEAPLATKAHVDLIRTLENSL